jgi:hypothetical protein
MATVLPLDQVLIPLANHAVLQDDLHLITVTGFRVLGRAVRLGVLYRARRGSDAIERVVARGCWNEVGDGDDRVDRHILRKVEFVRETTHAALDHERSRALLRELARGLAG